MWTQDDAITLCRQIEAICPAYGCHVALTGGLLYKDGARKDADILFYRVRQVEYIDEDALLLAMEEHVGVSVLSGSGWCRKAMWQGKPLDIFFPESDGGEYVRKPDAQDKWVF